MQILIVLYCGDRNEMDWKSPLTTMILDLFCSEHIFSIFNLLKYLTLKRKSLRNTCEDLSFHLRVVFFSFIFTFFGIWLLKNLRRLAEIFTKNIFLSLIAMHTKCIHNENRSKCHIWSCGASAGTLRPWAAEGT